jgi:hypothetical protein
MVVYVVSDDLVIRVMFLSMSAACVFMKTEDSPEYK